MPSEQTVAFERTASAVSKATGRDVIQGIKTISHDALSVSVDVAKLIPLPGIAEVTSILLTIWGFVQEVEVSMDGADQTIVPFSYLFLNELV